MDNNNYATEDINQASYLLSKNVKLLKIEPISLYKSKFHFETPPNEILQLWLAGTANTNAMALMNCYRQLAREARLAQQRLRGGV